MNHITTFFGRDVEDLFAVEPDITWRQSAPIIEDKLAFNQQDTRKLKSIKGGLQLSRAPAIDGMQLTYRIDKPMRGFVVGEKNNTNAIF